jgi:hypothetical protein
MRISRFFLPLLIIFISCNNKNHRPYTLFKKQVNLTADQVALNFSVYNPEHFEMIDSVLFVVDYYATGRNIIRAYNLADGQPLKSFCRKGLDSDEIVPPISISPDYKKKSLVVNGKRDNKFNTYALSDIKNGKTPDVAFSKVNTGMSVTVLKLDSQFVANGFFDDKRIAIMDNSGNIIKKTVDYPPIAAGLTDEEHFLTYQGNMIKNTGNNYLVLASAFSDNITFLAYDKGNISTLKYFQDQEANFKYYKVGGKKVFKPVGANIRGFIDLKGSKNHVFALYSGDPMKKYPQDNNVAASQILVYKWNGEPQAILNTDKDISYFVVDQDEQYLIGISYTPKPVFYKFSLKGKL